MNWSYLVWSCLVWPVLVCTSLAWSSLGWSMVMMPMVMTGGRRLVNGHDKLPMVMTNRLRRGLPMVMTLMVMTGSKRSANGHAEETMSCSVFAGVRNLGEWGFLGDLRNTDDLTLDQHLMQERRL